MNELSNREIERELLKAGIKPKDMQQMRDRRNILGDGATAPGHFKKVYQAPSIFNIPTGATVKVRFLGAIVPLWLHWLADENRSVPCFGLDCQRCPDRRTRYGYAPAVVPVNGPNGPEMQIRILSLTDNAMPSLIEKQLRGWLVSFFRENKKKPPRVEILETQSLDLPPSFNVQQELIRRFGLTAWPNQDMTEDDSAMPGVLKFDDEAQLARQSAEQKKAMREARGA